MEAFRVLHAVLLAELGIVLQHELLHIRPIRRSVIVAQHRQPQILLGKTRAQRRSILSRRSLRHIRHVRLHFLIDHSS